MKQELSIPRNETKVLLLEEVHQAAISRLQENGYNVKVIPRSLSSEELLEEIRDVHVLGIRSKTKINENHLLEAKKLIGIGCFGVGTSQVAVDKATSLGIPVFNAPFGNTRSVAELAMAFILSLARKASDKSCKMHKGHWDKSSKGAIEVRGKKLGIIGYGHIGQQVGLLAQAVGMEVIFFDLMKRLELANARQVETLDKLFKEADFVTLHVPALPGGRALIGAKELAKMKKGSYLLNLSRGNLIDFAALKEAITSKHLAGAGIDVYPSEPKTNNEPFQTELAGLDNVILTPHIGGSTEEAQLNIGAEVALTFVKFIDTGATTGAVNFPQVDLPVLPESHRILHVHRNIPGVLTEVNTLISSLGANIDSQYLSTYKDIGYLVMDVNKELSDEVRTKILALSGSIKTRLLY